MAEGIPRVPIGARIKQLRVNKGWSLSELAARAGISRSYLYQLELGESAPTHDKIAQLAHALGALPSELMGEPEAASDIPQSLREFSQQMDLGSAEVQMLAQIKYRGRRPSTVQEWRAIYGIITAMLDEPEEKNVPSGP
jgi:transcriptional regulator with XRE-family HTH domain